MLCSLMQPRMGPQRRWPQLVFPHCRSPRPPSSFISSDSLLFFLPLLVLLCDLLRGAGRQQRNLPVWNDLSSQHYHPNTPPSTLCYKGLGKLLFLWDMIKEMLPYVHIFYCPVLEQDMLWFTRLETAAVCLASVVTWLKGKQRAWILL